MSAKSLFPNCGRKIILKPTGHLHEENIYLRTCNLLGFPKERIENIYETIQINQQIKTDFPHPYLFYPFPKTELAKMAEDEGLLEKSAYKNIQVTSFHHQSMLDLDNKNRVENLHKLFILAVSCPKLTPIIKWVSQYNFRKIYWIIFKLSLSLKFKKTYKLSTPRAFINFFR